MKKGILQQNSFFLVKEIDFFFKKPQIVVERHYVELLPFYMHCRKSVLLFPDYKNFRKNSDFFFKKTPIFWLKKDVLEK